MFKLWTECQAADAESNKLAIDLAIACDKQDKCHAKLKRILVFGHGLNENAPDAEMLPLVKRLCYLERNDERIQHALHTHEQFFKEFFWKFVKQTQNGHAHCSSAKCAYLRERDLERYTGFYVCSLDHSVYVCDYCYIVMAEVHDIAHWMHILARREMIHDIIDEEVARCAYTDDEQKEVYARADEWRRFEHPAGVKCTDKGCPVFANYHLRGTHKWLCVDAFNKEFP